MRTLTYYMAALVSVLGIATSSQAGVIVDFQVGGSNTVSAAISSSITVDVFITVTPATQVSAYGITIDYDTAVVSGANSLANTGPVGFLGWTTPAFPGLSLDNGDGGIGAAIGSSTLTDGFEINGGFFPGLTVQIASVKFHVDGTGANAITGCFNCDPDGASGDNMIGDVALLGPDLSGQTTFNGLNIVPEPTTASLLGLGLLGLGVAGRRRS